MWVILVWFAFLFLQPLKWTLKTFLIFGNRRFLDKLPYCVDPSNSFASRYSLFAFVVFCWRWCSRTVLGDSNNAVSLLGQELESVDTEVLWHPSWQACMWKRDDTAQQKTLLILSGPIIDSLVWDVFERFGLICSSLGLFPFKSLFDVCLAVTPLLCF